MVANKGLAQLAADSSKKFLESINNLEQFLNLAELNELKENYTDLNYGDFILIFHNSDCLKIDKYVTFEEAVDLYDKTLMEKCDQEKNKNEILKEKLVYIKAFFQLEDYHSAENLTSKQDSKSANIKTRILEEHLEELIDWDLAKAIPWVEKMKKNRFIKKKFLFYILFINNSI